MPTSTPRRIALIAPVIEPVPPTRYGGTERVVGLLADELVRRGHEVTLFASGDSATSATLVAGCPQALRLAGVADYTGPTLAHVGDAYARATEFDLIHNHCDAVAFPFARMAPVPTLTTTHLRLDGAEKQALFGRYPEQPLVGISRSQRAWLPGARWLATTHHGVPLDRFRFRLDPGNYLVFLGRMSPEKRPDRAIEIARELGVRLVMAGKVDPYWDGDYFERFVKPMIAASPLVEFVGEVNEAEKDALLGGALAYLFPIDWPEPFGLTLIEAMATGTPVVAMACGAVPEIVVPGETGFVCGGMRQMIDAVERIPTIDRRACRAHVEAHFSAAVMTDAYERVYDQLLTETAVSSSTGTADTADDD